MTHHQAIPNLILNLIVTGNFSEKIATGYFCIGIYRIHPQIAIFDYPAYIALNPGLCF